MMQVIVCTVSGHVVSEDAEHVARAVRAIRQRRLNEVELSFEPAKANLLYFKGKNHV